MTTALLLYPGCVVAEVWPAMAWLGEAGPVRILTPDGQEHRTPFGVRIGSDGAPGSVDPAEVGCLVLPGGDPASVLWDPAVEDLIRGVAREGGWLGAVCAGAVLLGRAGVLLGRRHTHGYTADELPYVGVHFAGGITTGAAVEVDGHVVTARASAALLFAAELAWRAGALTRDEADRRLLYYTGGAASG